MDERKKETRIINKKFQNKKKINQILSIFIIVLMITIIGLRNSINNSFEPHPIESFLGKINGVVVIVLVIIFAFNIFRAINLVKKIKTMYTKEEIEEARRKKNEMKRKEH